MKTAYFAAGCFWGVQYKFDQLSGVTSTEVGYMGGSTESPTYKDVCNFETGHAEVVKVQYDPDVISYRSLVKFFLNIHDPTTLNRQGPDVGTQYRSAIFSLDSNEIQEAQSVIKECQAHFKNKIVTTIEQKLNYTSAEEYHQKYVEKNPGSCHI